MTQPDPAESCPQSATVVIDHRCSCGAELSGWATDDATAHIHTWPWRDAHRGLGHGPATLAQAASGRQRKAALMTDRSLRACRSCDGPIRWVLTEAGAKMPIDAEPVYRGNVLVTATRDKGIVAKVLTAERAAQIGGKLHRSHFASCPNAASQRRRP